MDICTHIYTFRSTLQLCVTKKSSSDCVYLQTIWFLLAAGRKKKQRHGETVIPPRSLFDRATPGMLKMRREGKEQKKNILLKQQTQFAKPLPTLVKPAAENGQDNPEWLISEDWALLQVRHLAFCCSVLRFPSNFINRSFNSFLS